MGDARRALDWEAQWACALDPETAKAVRASRSPEHDDTCSMCGKFCAVRSMNKSPQRRAHRHPVTTKKKAADRTASVCRFFVLPASRPPGPPRPGASFPGSYPFPIPVFQDGAGHRPRGSAHAQHIKQNAGSLIQLDADDAGQPLKGENAQGHSMADRQNGAGRRCKSPARKPGCRSFHVPESNYNNFRPSLHHGCKILHGGCHGLQSPAKKGRKKVPPGGHAHGWDFWDSL